MTLEIGKGWQRHRGEARDGSGIEARQGMAATSRHGKGFTLERCH